MDASPFARATRPQRPTISVPGPREGDLHHHRRQTRQDSTVSSSSRSVDDEVEDIARQNQEFDTMYWKPLKEHANVQYPWATARIRQLIDERDAEQLVMDRITSEVCGVHRDPHQSPRYLQAKERRDEVQELLDRHQRGNISKLSQSWTAARTAELEEDRDAEQEQMDRVVRNFRDDQIQHATRRTDYVTARAKRDHAIEELRHEGRRISGISRASSSPEALRRPSLAERASSFSGGLRRIASRISLAPSSEGPSSPDDVRPGRQLSTSLFFPNRRREGSVTPGHLNPQSGTWPVSSNSTGDHSPRGSSPAPMFRNPWPSASHPTQH